VAESGSPCGDFGTATHPAQTARLARALAESGDRPADPVPATGPSAVNPAAQLATNLRQAVLEQSTNPAQEDGNPGKEEERFRTRAGRCCVSQCTTAARTGQVSGGALAAGTGSTADCATR
jgi:hypothetical protein